MVIDCSKCPEGSGCCGILPFSKEFTEKHKNDFQVEPTEIREGVVVTDDFHCVFLNRKTRLCAIYDDRPEVCRLFGTKEGILRSNGGLACPHFKPNGNEWSKAMNARIRHKSRKNFIELLRKR